VVYPAQSDIGSPSRKLQFGALELEEARWLIDRAVREDIPDGDLTTDPLLGSADLGCQGAWLEADYVPRDTGVI